MKKTTATRRTFRIVATLENGREVVIASAPQDKLGRLVKAWVAFSETFHGETVDFYALQDNGLGRGLYTDTLIEDLAGMKLRGEVDGLTAKELATLTA